MAIMENLEDKFRYLEIDAELQELKQKIWNSQHQTGEKQSTSQSSNSFNPLTDEEKRIRFYAILGLSPNASIAEVKQAYRNLVKKCHPDLFFHNPILQQKAQEILTKINKAYDELCSHKSL